MIRRRGAERRYSATAEPEAQHTIRRPEGFPIAYCQFPISYCQSGSALIPFILRKLKE
jgi:hypothetical protein